MGLLDIAKAAKRRGAAAVKAIPVVGELLVELKGILPHLHDEAHVTVVGQPGANKRDLYFIAAAVGFSLVRRYDLFEKWFLPAGYISCEYDAAANSVTFSIKYRTCLTTANWGDAGRELGRIPLYGGPNEQHDGAPWNFKDELLGGVPGDDAGAIERLAGDAFATLRIPNVPFAGRTILTTGATCRDPDPTIADPTTAPVIQTPNPRPSRDRRSRSVGAVDLVYAALTSTTGQGLRTFPSPPGGMRAFNGE